MLKPTKVLTKAQLQFGSQLLKVKSRKDRPILMDKFNYKKMEKYYLDLALLLSEEVLK